MHKDPAITESYFSEERDMYLRTAMLPFALLCLATSCFAFSCKQSPGALVQIDVGAGQVFGVNSDDDIFTWYGQEWHQVTGKLTHVTVGSAGVWGVNTHNQIYKLVAGDWTNVPGVLKQIDAGGDQFVAGANKENSPYCLLKKNTIGYTQASDSANWVQLPGAMKYYSCGPISCWGVNHNDEIYVRKGVFPNACSGDVDWQHISGSLSMIEVGSDGSVYGVNSNGDIYQRSSVSCDLPEGESWSQVPVFAGQAKHVSYDLGHLWVVLKSGDIHDCTK
ncbi:hypothetical protein ACEWY4_002243 [Coilia grayii]|uniref:Fish-egg lectin-like n=1 Tax=Coilia grayii TaxID=363190 RepID=A0ABD1KV83_9TELE